MRYIVITLILANALYFGWRFLSPPPVTTVVAVAPLDKSQIQLIDDESDATASAEVEVPATAPKLDADVATSIDKPVAEQDIVAVTAATTTPDSETVAVPATTAPIAAPVVATLQCVITPWTRDEKQLQLWRNGWDEQSVEVITQEVETQRRFLVYIPAKATAEQTLERLREIKKLPVDSAHINKGEYIGGISLGLFSQLESAQTILHQVHELGITDARQTVRILTATEYRLRRQTAESFSEPWTLCPNL